MSIVYTINVGANSSHGSVARSPIFPDGRFVYVSFPTESRKSTQAYVGAARNFVRNPDSHRTHADPDWDHLTYGDYCTNPRAGALKRVQPGDILLFWGVLWSNQGHDWAGFTGDRDWFLLGALRISEILAGGELVSRLSLPARKRALLNAHLEGAEQLGEGHYVFLGDLKHSKLFSRAVPLEPSKADGLIYRSFTTADRKPLSLHGAPAWSSSLRSCRPMWDLDQAKDRARADIARIAIREYNDFDLLDGG